MYRILQKWFLLPYSVRQQKPDAEGLAGSVLRNREIVSKLYASGIFNIKDAVIQVADCLNISKNTVYLHLRHCKGLE